MGYIDPQTLAERKRAIEGGCRLELPCSRCGKSFSVPALPEDAAAFKGGAAARRALPYLTDSEMRCVAESLCPACSEEAALDALHGFAAYAHLLEDEDGCPVPAVIPCGELGGLPLAVAVGEDGAALVDPCSVHPLALHAALGDEIGLVRPGEPADRLPFDGSRLTGRLAGMLGHRYVFKGMRFREVSVQWGGAALVARIPVAELIPSTQDDLAPDPSGVDVPMCLLARTLNRCGSPWLRVGLRYAEDGAAVVTKDGIDALRVEDPIGLDEAIEGVAATLEPHVPPARLVTYNTDGTANVSENGVSIAFRVSVEKARELAEMQ